MRVTMLTSGTPLFRIKSKDVEDILDSYQDAVDQAQEKIESAQSNADNRQGNPPIIIPLPRRSPG